MQLPRIEISKKASLYQILRLYIINIINRPLIALIQITIPNIINKAEPLNANVLKLKPFYLYIYQVILTVIIKGFSIYVINYLNILNITNTLRVIKLKTKLNSVGIENAFRIGEIIKPIVTFNNNIIIIMIQLRKLPPNPSPES